MSQKNITLLMLVAIIAMFGVLSAYDKKGDNYLENILRKDRADNWQWNNEWTDEPKETTPFKPQPEEEVQKEEKTEEIKSQIVATNYQEALKKSGELGKPILLVFSAKWCSWCDKLKNETLTDPEVKNLMMNYIFLIVDTDRDGKTGQKFGVRGLPSCVITNCNEEKLKADAGFKPATVFAEWLNDKELFVQPKK